MSYLHASEKMVSIVGILLCAAGVAGIWTIHGALTDGLTRSLSGIEFVIDIARKRTLRVEEMTYGLQDKLSAIRKDMVSTVQDGTEIIVTPAALAQITALNLETQFETADEMVEQVREVVISANHLVETANALPFLSIPSLPENHLETMHRRLYAMASAARDIELISLDLQANGTGKAVSTLMVYMDKIHSLTRNIQLPVTAFNDAAAAAQKAAALVIEKISTWVLTGSITLSLIFIWFIYAQVCLVVRARSPLRG